MRAWLRHILFGRGRVERAHAATARMEAAADSLTLQASEFQRAIEQIAERASHA